MTPLAQQTLYEILEVPPDSPAGEIEAAYARAREVYAPGSIITYSLMSPEDAELLAARLDEARATLLDPAARARYDAGLVGRFEPAPSTWPAAIPPVIPALTLAPRTAYDDDADRDGSDVPGRAAAAEASPDAWRDAPPVRSPRPTPLPIRLEREVPEAPTRTPPPIRGPLPSHTPAPVSLPAALPAPTPAREAAADAAAWTGEVLRQLREARGISIQQISERTKVTRHHIENIEADRYGQLPAPVYLRGILLGVARELRLDGQKVARSYLERMAASAGASGTRR